jgi:hypothetical protein
MVEVKVVVPPAGAGADAVWQDEIDSSVYYSVVPYAVVYKSVSKVIYCADSGEKCITMLGLEAPTREVLRYSSFKKLHKS